MPNDSNSRYRHPAIRTYLQMQQTSEPTTERPARRRKTADTRRQATAPAPTARFTLVTYAEQRAAQEVQRLAQFTQVQEASITDKLSAQCKRKNGRKDDPALAACKKFLLSAGMNLLASQGLAQGKILEVLETAAPAQHVVDLLEKLSLPEEYALLRSSIGPEDWDALKKNSGGYALLALLVLKQELASYSIADLVRCAKKGSHGQELVALTDGTYATWIRKSQDRTRIAANSGGWKNLEAAKAYLEGLFQQRAALEQQGYTQQQIDHAMAPFTIPMEKMVSILSNIGGSKNLEAAKAYLEGLFQQRVQTRQTLMDNAQALGMGMAPEQIEHDIDHVMAPFTIPMEDMVSILSNNGGSKNLEEAKAYLEGLFQQRAALEQQGQTQQQIDHAMAPFAIPMKDMVSILSHGGGSNNLEAAKAYLKELSQQRAALEQQGYTQQQIDHAMAPFTIPMKDMVSILSHKGGSKNLKAAKAYLEWLFQQRVQTRQTLMDNAQVLGMVIAPEQIEHDIDHVMASFTIPMKDMVRILSHDGGSKNLEAAKAYLEGLFQQRAALEQQGHTQQQIDHAMASFTIPMKDMVSILSNNGGSKNLEAAKAYLEGLFQQRAALEQQGYTQQQIDHAMAPFAIPMKDMVSILSHGGGSNNLEAAKAYLKELSQQRAALEQQGYTQQQIDHAMAPFTIPMKDMVSILSNNGGSNNLEAAKAYLEGLFQQRAALAQQGYIQQQIDHAMAPFTIPMKDMVSILSHDGGSKNLEAAKAYLEGLFQQRAALEQQGHTQQQIGHAMTSSTIPMKDMVRILSHGGGSKNLEAAKAYLEGLFQQRAALEQQGHTQQQIDHAMASFTIPMKDMVRILSNHGGSKNLEAAKAYLKELSQQRAALEQQGYTQQQIDHAMTPFTITMEKLVSTVAQPRGAKRLKELLDSMKSQS